MRVCVRECACEGRNYLTKEPFHNNHVCNWRFCHFPVFSGVAWTKRQSQKTIPINAAADVTRAAPWRMLRLKDPTVSVTFPQVTKIPPLLPRVRMRSKGWSDHAWCPLFIYNMCTKAKCKSPLSGDWSPYTFAYAFLVNLMTRAAVGNSNNAFGSPGILLKNSKQPDHTPLIAYSIYGMISWSRSHTPIV